MDFWTAFWITIFMGIASWIAVKTGHGEVKVLLGIIGTASVVVPMLVIYLSGVLGMYRASGTDQTANIAATTVNNLVTWLAHNIESIVAGDVAGIILGVVFSSFR